MQSKINHSPINENYPVPGRNNSSQGMRDNFSAIKIALGTASTEVSNLQYKAILNRDLTFDQPADNDFYNSSIHNAIYYNLRAYMEVTAVTDNFHRIDVSLASVHTIVLDSDCNLQFTNWPNAGDFVSVKIILKNNYLTDHTVGFSSENTGKIIYNNRFPTVPLTIERNPHVLEAWSYDGGNIVHLFHLGNFGAGPDFPIDADDLTIAGIFRNLDTTQATSLTNASSIFYGGVTVKRNLHVGENIVAYNDISAVTVTVQNDIVTTNLIADNMTVNENLTVSGDIFIGDSETILELAHLDNIFIDKIANKDQLSFDLEINKWTNYGNLIEYSVKLDDNGSGTQEVFFFNNTSWLTSDGVPLNFDFKVGKKYRFKLDDISNAHGALRFSTTPDTSVPASITNYSEDVTIIGDAGTEGAYVEILITDSTPTLYFYALESDSAIDTSLIGGAYPIKVGSNPILVQQNYTALGNQILIVDSENAIANLTIKLPSEPTIGSWITILSGENAENNPFVIHGNGKQIDNNSQVNVNINASTALLYFNGTRWQSNLIGI